MAAEHLLIIDDDPLIRKALPEVFRIVGFEVDCAEDGRVALEMVAQKQYSVAFMDLGMPGLSGLDAIRRLKKVDPSCEVVVFTGEPSLESSIEALREHVFDYICKPAEIKHLQRTAFRAAERRRLVIERNELQQQLEAERGKLKQQLARAGRALSSTLERSHTLVGNSEAIQRIRSQIAEIAPTDMTVLILGESGTGKDVVARLIHELSGRDPKAFAKINCPAIPETLLESELFGYENGAFTGAVKQKPGRLELGDGGTVFLDEMGDLPLSLQAKLLQVLEHKQFMRVGGNKTLRIDTRIIAATNQPIEKMMADGRFRPDLFYRLNEYSIKIPPLREHKEDIPLLIDHFLAIFSSQFDTSNCRLSPDAMNLVMRHDWPGNIRELQSLIRRFALQQKEDAFSEHIGGDSRSTMPILASAVPLSAPQAGADANPAIAHESLRLAAARGKKAEIQAIINALTAAKWNQRKAAKLLDASYSTLRRRIAKYNLMN